MLQLMMIVKNEVHTLARTLQSAKPFIDRWTILDTGSTDGTQELILKEMEGVPGELHEGSFVDFATTRNRALELAGEATEWVMWLDADDELIGRDFRQFLSGLRSDAAYVEVTVPGVSFKSTRVMRARARWRFRGVVHEVLMGPDGEIPAATIPEIMVRHVAHGVSGEKSRQRWERDVGLLTEELQKNPTCTRSTFYLAQTYLWLRRLDEAERTFRRRVELGGWREEIYQSLFDIARISQMKNDPWEKTMPLFLGAHKFFPHRAEPLEAIARHYDTLREYSLSFLFARRGYELPLPEDILFVDAEAYRWKMADLTATAAWWIGEYGIGEAAAAKAVANNPGDPRLERNLKFFRDRRSGDRPDH